MVSVAEATTIIQSNLFKPKSTDTDISEVIGKVLAEHIYADRDFPPFNRVAMDGIAINFEAWNDGHRNFKIESIQAAGEPQKALGNPKHCIEIMTGAILPVGTDTIIRYEDIVIEHNHAQVQADKIVQRQNIHPQGQDCKRDDLLLTPGVIISPAEVALLASVGRSKVKTYVLPKAAIVASGNELVDIDTVPLPHQIRRSNTFAIHAAMHEVGWDGKQFHLPDEKNILKNALSKIIEENEVIILSGGVSKGKFDFIPEVMEVLGVKKFFHQVSQRPGKPFWFGATNEGKIIFALPGNPVSTYMCFYRYILPWLWKSLNIDVKTCSAMLSNDFIFQPNLTYFVQVKIKNEDGKILAYTVAGGGSGDFANLKDVDGFLELPMDKSAFTAGEVFPLISFRH